ncbi:MAG TPA: AgmX/PglI C-terminal domain-containing protein [Polyangia bacterium]|nr:AgmX/PglI C-terminal domain-containing protein [Polyangia bacterium]
MRTRFGRSPGTLGMGALLGLILGLGLVGCGGASRQQRQDKAPSGALKAVPPAEQVYPPDRIEHIQEVFGRRTQQVQDCYREAQVTKGAEPPAGDVVISMTLTPAGRAVDVRVERSALASPPIESCLSTLVQTWEFGELPTNGRFSYTFHFAPNL